MMNSKKNRITEKFRVEKNKWINETLKQNMNSNKIDKGFRIIKKKCHKYQSQEAKLLKIKIYN